MEAAISQGLGEKGVRRKKPKTLSGIETERLARNLNNQMAPEKT